MSWFRQLGAVIAKDVLVELRSPTRVSGLFFYGLALLLLVAFASNTTDIMRKQAGGILWIGMLLASTRSFDQSFGAEFEEGAMEGLVLWPVHPVALYYGKAISNSFILVVVAAALMPLLVALYDVSIRGDIGALALNLLLGCTALAAPGTLLALITTQARGASVLLPLLLFPTVVPAVLAASRATTLIIEGDPMGQVGAWLWVLAAVNLLHWSISGVLFAKAVEDG
ncbi:MAG: heme exporter protein CcmB [Deltaproteobacteria bacterium]|nr:heme exporter protein CcmB [Deltaproteobacteria bacterium]